MNNLALEISHPTDSNSINVSTLRKLLGFLNSKTDSLSYNLFRLSTDKEFANRFPSIIFGGNQDKAVIKAYGEFASKTLSDSIDTIKSLLNEHFETELNYNTFNFELTATEIPNDSNQSELNYYIRSLVIQDVDDKIPSSVIAELKEGIKSDYIIRKIQFMIVKGLKEQSRALKMKTPFLTVSNIDFSSSVPLKSKDNVLQLAVKDVTFSLNVDLSDNWYTGLLKSRGFGEIERGSK